MNRKKYLLKNTIIFALSTMSTKLISFFLVPMYTNALTPDEYGIVDLYFTISSFLFPLFTLNISESIYRFSMDKDYDNKKIYNIGISCALLCIVLGLATLPLFSLITIYKKFAIQFYVYLVTFSISQILLVSLKGQEKLKFFSIGNIINTLGIAVFNIIFLVVFKLGINGYFLGYIVANIITIIFGIINTNFVSNVKKFEFDKKLFLEMTKYSVVLIPTSFMWWITNSSDRIMISAFVNSYSNGLYAVSYKIPSILTVIASIFNQAWSFSAIKEKDTEDSSTFTNNMFNILFFIVSLSSIIILLIIKPLFKIYVSSEYYNAWKYVPILIVGFIFMTLATFVSTSYNVYKDSKGFLFSGLVGAFANIILNLVLIPPFGVYGAAVATMISYISVFIYRLADTKKYIKINFSIRHYLSVIIVSVCASLIYFKNEICYFLAPFLIIIYLVINKNTISYIKTNALTILKQKIKHKQKK